jgi:ketosteroid isomerase-like protein
MRAAAISVLAVAAAAVAGCTGTWAAPQTVSQVSAQDELRSRTAAFSQAIVAASSCGWSAEAVTRIAEFYAHDTVVFPPRGETMRGRAAQVTHWTRPPHRQILAHSVIAERIDVSGDLATEWGTLRVTFKEGDAAAAETISKYISVWTRNDGVWRKQMDSWW